MLSAYYNPSYFYNWSGNNYFPRYSLTSIKSIISGQMIRTVAIIRYLSSIWQFYKKGFLTWEHYTGYSLLDQIRAWIEAFTEKCNKIVDKQMIKATKMIDGQAIRTLNLWTGYRFDTVLCNTSSTVSEVACKNLKESSGGFTSLRMSIEYSSNN